jgi:hypothetical protein
MVRRAALIAVGGYDAAYRVCNDYDLWLRLGQQTKLANLPDLLLYYRRHAHNTGARHSEEMSREIAAISRRAIAAEIGVTISPDEALLLRSRHHPAPRRTDRRSRLLVQLAVHIKQKHALSAADWETLRHDATRRILRLAWRKGDLPSAVTALACVVRLDPGYAVRWVASKPQALMQGKAAAPLKAGGG